MALPTHVEMFVLVALLCVCMFMFFVTREIARIDRSISLVSALQEQSRGHVDVLGTHVTSWTTRFDALSQKLDLHASAIEKIEWGTTTTQDDEGSDQQDDEEEDEGGQDEDDEDAELDEDDQTSLQMRTLLSHIDSIRHSSDKRRSPTLTHISEEVLDPGISCTVTECETPKAVNEAVVHIPPSTPPDLKQVKAILKANHVDCRGNRETLMKRFSALQTPTPTPVNVP